MELPVPAGFIVSSEFSLEYKLSIGIIEYIILCSNNVDVNDILR